MSNDRQPDREILLAEYTLGLLDPREYNRAQALLAEDLDAVIEALNWEHTLLDLVDRLDPVTPPPTLLPRIQAGLGHRPVSVVPPIDAYDPEPKLLRPAASDAQAQKVAPVTAREPIRAVREPTFSPEPESAAGAPRSSPVPPAPAAAPPSPSAHPSPSRPDASEPPSPDAPARKLAADRIKLRLGSLWLWRAAALFFALATVALLLMPKAPEPPKVTVVQVAPTQAAILQAPGQTSTPGWLVTIDAQHNVNMKPLVHTDVPPDASVQLWTHSRAMPQPRSLGLVDPNQPVVVPAAIMGDLAQDQIFEMTLEEKDGSATGGPAGPILFIGRIVTFGQPEAPPLQGGAVNTTPR